ARVGGGIAAQSPPPSVACGGEACRGVSGGAPGALSFASALLEGAGNLAPPPPSKAKKTPSRSKQLAKALRACRSKHNRAKRKKCEARARRALVARAVAGVAGAPEVSEKLSERAHVGAEAGPVTQTADPGSAPSPAAVVPRP